MFRYLDIKNGIFIFETQSKLIIGLKLIVSIECEIDICVMT